MAPLLRAAIAALTVLVLLPAAARADDCSGQTLDRTFLPWADPAFYTPGPEGWTRAGRAAVENDGAVARPAGASTTTAPICIGLGHPTVRFFARNAGNPLSLL